MTQVVASLGLEGTSRLRGRPKKKSGEEAARRTGRLLLPNTIASQ